MKQGFNGAGGLRLEVQRSSTPTHAEQLQWAEARVASERRALKIRPLLAGISYQIVAEEDSESRIS